MAGGLNKTVSLKLVTDSGTALAKLEEFATDADKLNGKRSTLQVNVQSGDTKAQLDEITAKAEALGIKNVRFNVTADTKTADKNIDETKNKAGSLRKSFLDAGLGITGFGDAVTVASGDSSMFARVLGGVNLATGLLEPVMAGGVVAVGALGSGLVAAGAGFTVFSTVAKAALSQVSGAVKAYETAQSTSGKASATAMKNYEAQLSALTPAQRVLTGTVIQFDTAWQNFVNKATPGVTKVLNSGLKLIPTVFKDMGMFLGPVETALGHVTNMLSKGLNSSGTQSFIKDLASNSGPALEKLAVAIGHIVQGIMGILHAFMPMSQTMLSGVDKLTAKFAKWGETLNQHTGFQSLMSMFKTETPLAVKVLENLAVTVTGVVKAMIGLDGVGNSKTLLQMLIPLTSLLAKLANGNPILDRTVLYMIAAGQAGGKLKNVFQSLSSGVDTIKNISTGVSNFSKGFNDAEKAADTATGVMGTLGGKVSNLGSFFTQAALKLGILRTATTEATVAQEGLDVAMEANPIGLIIVGITLLVAAFVVLWLKSAAFRDFFIGVWHDITGAVSAAFDWIKGHWNLIFDILIGPVGLAVKFIVTHWNDIVTGASKMVGSIVSFMTSLPGKIVNALSSLASDMFNVGVNIIWGVIKGVEHEVTALWNYLGNIAKSIGNVFSKVLSIFSPSKVFFAFGQYIVLGLIGGIKSLHPAATGTVANLASAVAGAFRLPTGRLAPGGLGAQSGTTVHANITVQGIVGDAGATGKQIATALNTYLRQTGQPQVVGV